MRRKSGGVPSVGAQREGPSCVYVARVQSSTYASSSACTALLGVRGAWRQCTEDATERRGVRVGARADFCVWLVHSSTLTVISAHGLGVCVRGAIAQRREREGGGHPRV